VSLLTNRTERLEPGSVLHSARGELRVRSSRPFGDRWLVFFDGVEDRAAADALRGTTLEAPAISDPAALWVHDLVGARVRSTTGEELGTVKAVVANPASDLLELESGRLVPSRFVTECRDGSVVVEVPPGLLD
jgi:16S rRNA processing protein RimM